ncbi:hypothetical protein [Turicibacter sanguinis]|uniref:hypothetical protein n=1 Tax=Turicibacter sanguinis TaxID=154288 RepID=UPI0018ABFFDE|nr:hypothetical protein [Turicibacter sanguinis]MDB8567899.1 hypothetical protein [Turicibacter sanguinis]MDB8570648.1 hypothetical protein [Turicibacter sanguinis]MDB8573401.1 hypothetical protein [Turicibacter sanguinis]MDB8582161.1 hypothetical protein [Turicibacter sanguinis]
MSRYDPIQVHRQLIKEGFSVSLKRIKRLMKASGLASIIQKKYTPYKQSKELVLERHNIVEQDFSMTSINQKMGIIYCLYLHSKKIISYHFLKQMTKDIIVKALKNAYTSQKPKDEINLHTDLASQYTNQQFKHLTFLVSKILT